MFILSTIWEICFGIFYHCSILLHVIVIHHQGRYNSPNITYLIIRLLDVVLMIWSVLWIDFMFKFSFLSSIDLCFLRTQVIIFSLKYLIPNGTCLEGVYVSSHELGVVLYSDENPEIIMANFVTGLTYFHNFVTWYLWVFSKYYKCLLCLRCVKWICTEIMLLLSCATILH